MAKPKKKYSDLNKREINYIKNVLGITKIQDIDITILKQLKEELKKLKDVRCKNMIWYKQWDIIMCVILASFADNNDWTDIHDFVVDNYKWFKSFLLMTGGIPTAATYERIMGLVDSNELNTILFDFFDTLTFKQTPDVNLANIDGRVNNGSKRNSTILNETKTPLNCLNVYLNEYGYCVSTTQIDEKSNEIPAVEAVVSNMDLTGIIVTWDALNTQTKNVSAVIKSGGDYIVPVKGNQGIFHANLVEYFDQKRCEEIIAGNSQSQYLTYTEKSHSQIIKYELFLTSDINWYSKKDDWEGLKSFGYVKKTIIKQVYEKSTRKNAKNKDQKLPINKTVVEERYYISSRQVNISEFNSATREHWSVENKVHWHLDFTFCQDDNSTTNKKALLNLDIIHKFVLAILERVKPRYNMSLKKIRKHLSRDFEEFFPELVCYLILKN